MQAIYVFGTKITKGTFVQHIELTTNNLREVMHTRCVPYTCSLTQLDSGQKVEEIK